MVRFVTSSAASSASWEFINLHVRKLEVAVTTVYLVITAHSVMRCAVIIVDYPRMGILLFATETLAYACMAVPTAGIIIPVWIGVTVNVNQKHVTVMTASALMAVCLDTRENFVVC